MVEGKQPGRPFRRAAFSRPSRLGARGPLQARTPKKMLAYWPGGLYNTGRFLKRNTVRRTKEEALETRNTILRVALESFSKRGYALTTFNDIAQKIHLTKGAIFWHFKTKEDLLAALLAWLQESFDPFKPLETATTLAEVRAAFLAWADVLATNRQHRQFMIFVMSRVEWSEALKAKLRQKLDALMVNDPYDRLVACMERLKDLGEIASPLSGMQIAALLSSCFFGWHREAWLHKSHANLGQLNLRPTLEAGLDFILNGIRRTSND